MDFKRAGFWVSTGIVALALAASCGAYLYGAMDSAMAHLGYPRHFVVLLGLWKGAAAVALCVRAYPRITEWAYAGLFFTFSGAAIAHAAVGDGVAEIASPLLMGALAAGSYLLDGSKE